MRTKELTKVYMYGFAETQSWEIDHVMLETGKALIHGFMDIEKYQGSIESFLLSQGYKVFHIFDEMPVVSTSDKDLN